MKDQKHLKLIIKIVDRFSDKVVLLSKLLAKQKLISLERLLSSLSKADQEKFLAGKLTKKVKNTRSR